MIVLSLHHTLKGHTMGPFDFVAWRDRLGFSQASMAKHLGVTRETVNRWEKGKQPIPAKYAGDGAAAPAVQPITPATHPELYQKFRPGKWVKSPLHPDYLIGERMVENEYGEQQRMPHNDDVLRSEAYIEARAAAHERVKQRMLWENSIVANTIYPDAVGNETVAQYKNRTSQNI